MSFGRVFETISDEPQEVDLSELLRTGAEVARHNARTHGLTAELAPKSVLEWYRIILNDPTADLPVMEALSDQQRLALNLAQSEVRLRSALHAIEDFEQIRRDLAAAKERILGEYPVNLMHQVNRSQIKADWRVVVVVQM
jgi:hypothetical protein